jgi:hypothetical protein
MQNALWRAVLRSFGLTIVVGFVLASPLPAAAQFFTSVQSSASTSNGLGSFDGGEISYGSNTGSDGGTFGTGYGSATPTFSSTTGLGQTSAFANYNVTDNSLRSATANTSIDLSSGTVHLYASGGGTSGGESANSQAQFQDHLTFSVPGAAPNQVTPIGVKVTLSGGLSGGPSSIADITLTAFDFEGVGSGVDGFVQYEGNDHEGTYSIERETALNWVSADFTGTGTQNLVFNGTYDLVGSSETVLIDFNATASVSSEDTATSDYSHTGQISLSLPGGVSFTSDSGVFLTASPVPEPATAAVLFPAFIGTILAYRRRRRSIAARAAHGLI